MLLTDLPSDALGHIIRYLDSASVAAFAQVCTLFRNAVHACVISVRFVELNRRIGHFLDWHGHRVRLLDLSQCTSAIPRQLEDLVLKCVNLQQLNLVNTRITVSGIDEILHRLRRLRSVRFGLPTGDSTGSPNSLCYYHFRPNYNINHVYIEVPHTIQSCVHALRFIYSCKRLTSLHWFMVGHSEESGGRALRKLDIWERKQLERALNVSRLVVSWETEGLIENSPVSLRDFIRIEDEIYQNILARGWKQLIIDNDRINLILDWTEGRGVTADAARPTAPSKDDCARSSRNVSSDNYAQANRIYCLDANSLSRVLAAPVCGAPRRLVVCLKTAFVGFVNVPHPLICLSNVLTCNLTELNVTGCHMRFPEAAWSMLVEATPALNALAFPMCFLPPAQAATPVAGSSSSSSSSLSSTSPAWFREPPAWPLRCPVIASLSALRLKVLYMTGESCCCCVKHINAEQTNAGKSLGKVSDLPHLESLTVIRVHLITWGSTFLDNLWSPTLKTAKLIELRHRWEFDFHLGLRRFLQRCKSLENLKIDHTNMKLKSAPLWEALSEASLLRQLCITVNTTVDVDIATKNLTKLRGQLRHLHIHRVIKGASSVKKALDKFFEVESSEEDESYSYGDVERPGCSRSYPTSRKSCSVVITSKEPLLQQYPLSGKSVCCTTTFIGQMKPEGWEFTT